MSPEISVVYALKISENLLATDGIKKALPSKVFYYKNV